MSVHYQPPSGAGLMLQRRRIGLSKCRLAAHAECSTSLRRLRLPAPLLKRLGGPFGDRCVAASG